MPRKKRLKIEFTEDSVNDYLQEVYNESFTLKSRIDVLFRKWETKIKDGTEIAAMGDSLVKLINAMGKNQDQKIMILKYLKEIVFLDKQTNQEVNANSVGMSRNDIIKAATDAIREYENLSENK